MLKPILISTSLLTTLSLASPQIAFAQDEVVGEASGATESALPVEAKTEIKKEEVKKELAAAPNAAPAATTAPSQAVQTPATQAATTEAPAEQQAASNGQPESKTFVSEGAPFALETLGVTITPPKGWEVVTNGGNLSVVMREPRDPNPSYEKPKYQRNVTVAAIHQPSPVDERRAKELREEMTKRFGADSSISNFQILEHKFFNYRGVNDGLVLFSTLNLGEYQMMQMHVLVSGQEKQFLMTYTDLTEQFMNKNNGTYDQAWSTMTSIDVKGKGPVRQDEYIRYGAIGGGIFLLAAILYFLRRRASKHDFNADADAMLDDADSSHSLYATMAGGWNFATKADSAMLTAAPAKAKKQDAKKAKAEKKAKKDEETADSAYSLLSNF